MPRDPVLIEEIDAWFLKAEHDLRSTRALLNASQPLADTAVYHCQQAPMKSQI
jgi:hypothetical protein